MPKATAAERETLLRDRVYHDVRQEIVGGQLKPGMLIRETDVARRYGVSKSPVREGMLVLAFEGWLTPLPGAGYMVTQVTLRDVQDTFQLRALIEVEGAGWAAERITEKELVALQECFGQQGASPSDARAGSEPPNGTERPLQDVYPDSNHLFHLRIARASGNERLPTILEALLYEMDRVALRRSAVAWQTMDSEHSLILDALGRHDPEAARDAMRKHIESSRAITLSSLS